MNALPSALPTLPPSTPASAAGPASADGDGGFADALQQARQPQAPEGKPERAAAGERPREARVAESRPAARDAAPDKPAPADPETDDTPSAGTGTTAGDPAEPAAAALLPPWLEAALARPARSAEALAAGRSPTETPAAAPRARDAAAAAAGRGGPSTAAALQAQGAADAAASRTAAEPAGERTPFAAVLQQAQAEAPRSTQTAAELPVGSLTASAGTPAAGGAAAGPARAEVAERSLPAPLHGPEFAPALGAQLNLLVRDGITEARLHLNPAEMGPISVQIQIEGQTARVEMTAEQSQTRQVLEQAMPVLAGALRESGLTLTGGGVFEQRRESQGEPGGRPGTAPGQTGTGDGAAAEEAPRPVAVPQGMVDLYA